MSVQDDCSVELWVTSMWFQSSSVGDPSHTDSSCTVAHYSFIDFNLPVNSALEPAHVIYTAVKWQVHSAAGHLQGERNLGTADGNRSIRLQFSRWGAVYRNTALKLIIIHISEQQWMRRLRNRKIGRSYWQTQRVITRHSSSSRFYSYVASFSSLFWFYNLQLQRFDSLSHAAVSSDKALTAFYLLGTEHVFYFEKKGHQQ